MKRHLLAWLRCSIYNRINSSSIPDTVCHRPNLHSSVIMKPNLETFTNGSQITFFCKSPSDAGSNVPLRLFGSEWARCCSTSSQWSYQFDGVPPYCETDSKDFENKLQVAVTVFACTLMACLVFLMFILGFKAYNYRKEYKHSHSRPQEIGRVMSNPNAYLVSPSKKVLITEDHDKPYGLKPAISKTNSIYSSEASMYRSSPCRVYPPRIKRVSFSDEVSSLEADSPTELRAFSKFRRDSYNRGCDMQKQLPWSKDPCPNVNGRSHLLQTLV